MCVVCDRLFVVGVVCDWLIVVGVICDWLIVGVVSDWLFVDVVCDWLFVGVVVLLTVAHPPLLLLLECWLALEGERVEEESQLRPLEGGLTTEEF